MAGVRLNTELKRLRDFHGHLGPYVIVGLKMGKIARGCFGNAGKKLNATVFTGKKPPLSCIADGIQFSSGCTLGKGNINVVDKGTAKAVFKKDEEILTITLKKKIRNEIDKTMTEENELERSLWIYGMDIQNLFDIS
ncbi:MAG: formylmethanofuran dehydrogenase subunit E family protein [Thermoplasmata archaeon]